MKIKLLFLISIFTFSYIIGFSQTETSNKKNKFEFSTGYTIGALKNLEYAPLSRYDYKGLVYKLGYERTGKNQNIFSIQLDFLNSELTSDLIPALNLDYAKIGLSVSYLKQAYSTDKFDMHLGLQSYSNVSIYSKSNNQRSVVNQSFGIGSRFSYQINENHALFSKLTIPVVLFRVTDATANIFSLNRYQSVLWNIGYKHALSNRLDLKFSYNINYDRLQIPNTFREVQYQFNVGLNFKF